MGRTRKNCCRRCGSDGKIFCFPQDIARRKLWIEKSQLLHLSSFSKRSLDHMGFCSVHFEEWCFANINRARLVHNAVPTKFQESEDEHGQGSETGDQQEEHDDEQAFPEELPALPNEDPSGTKKNSQPLIPQIGLNTDGHDCQPVLPEDLSVLPDEVSRPLVSQSVSKIRNIPIQAKARKRKTVGTSTTIQVEYTFPENTLIPEQQLQIREETKPPQAITVIKEEDGYQCEVLPPAIYEPQDLLGAAFDNADIANRNVPQIATLPTEMVIFRRPDPPPPIPKSTETSLSARIANAEIKEAIVKYVSTDIIPASWLDGKGFRKFAQTLLNVGATYGKLDVGEIMPDSTTVSERLNQQARHLRSQTQETIQHDNPAQFSVSVDTWLNANNQQYATVTVHYITEHFLLRTHRLDTIQTEDETMEVQIRNVLDCYGLGQPKSIVTKPEQEGCYTTSDTMPCPVALLNQVAGSVFSSETDYLPAKLFLSCNIILAHAQNSERAIKYRSFLPRYEKRSDWPSKCQFLSAVANSWDILLSIAGKIDGLATLMLEVDVTQLRCVATALQPFKDALDLLSIQTEPTSHFVVPIVRKLETHLQHCVDDNDDVKQVKLQLLGEFMKVKDKLLNKMACCALFFDPSKKSLRITDENDREVARETIFSELRLIDSELCLEMPQDKRPKTHFDLEEFSDFDHTFKDPVTAEFERYFHFQISQQGEGLTTSVLNWWKNNRINFPRLAQLGLAYLSIPTVAAASNSCETSILERRKFLESDSVSDILILNGHGVK